MHQLANLVSNGACGGGRVEAVTSLVELAIQGRPLGLHAFLVESAIMGLAIHPVHTEITPFPGVFSLATSATRAASTTRL